MSKIVLGFTLSLDGYSSDPTGSVGPLYPDFAALQASAPMLADIANTGAVVMGRRTFDMAPDPDNYAFDYEYQVPLFIVTHQPPARHPKEGGGLTITFVTDGVVSALTQARAAAGDKYVNVIGAGGDLARQCLRTGLVDEIHVIVMPLLLGGGQRPLDQLDPLALERLAVVDWPSGGTGITYRVVK